jgi:hypothetical protein
LGNLFFFGFSHNPRKEYFMPLIMFIQRRLPSCSMYLNYGSKLRLVNSVLSSSPIFCISTLKFISGSLMNVISTQAIYGGTKIWVVNLIP